jgi:Histidine phosphatase superfamily (branch 2)
MRRNCFRLPAGAAAADCVLRLLLVLVLLRSEGPSSSAAAAALGRQLKQVHVITRHGSRYPLVKDANTMREGTVGMLTATGEKQLYDLGVWIRNRFFAAGSSSSNNVSSSSDALLAPAFNPAAVQLTSSDYQRTVVSANAMALGLWDATARDPAGEDQIATAAAASQTGVGGDGNTSSAAAATKSYYYTRPNVPVYTLPKETDTLLRAYDKCPAYKDKLHVLYDSAQWQNLEQNDMALLQHLAQIPAFAQYKRPAPSSSGVGNGGGGPDYVALEDLWNVFDAITVAQTECGTNTTATSSTATANSPSSTCRHLPNASVATVLSDAKWQRLQTLAHLAESLKFSDEVAGSLLGGNLIMHIADAMMAKVAATTAAATPNFFLYSAHYPTILSVLASLNGTNVPNDDALPPYASALWFALYEDAPTASSGGQQDVSGAGSGLVEIWYKAGGNDAAVQIGETICPNATSCSLDEFLDFVRLRIRTTNWCVACANTDFGVCASSIRSATGDGGAVRTCRAERAGVAMGFFGGILFMALMTMFWFLYRTWDQQRRSKRGAAPIQDDTDFTAEEEGVPPQRECATTTVIEDLPAIASSGETTMA